MNKPEGKPEKMSLASMDVAAEKRAELKRCLGQAFPEVFAEGGINFDQLKRSLAEWVDPGKERFGLNWPGKAECMKIIQQPSVATLKPARNKSVDFDTTENLLIEGDNLEVLKLLQKAYFGKIKMIYIDPPYNTGEEFIYPDKYAETLDTYLAYTGQADKEGRIFSTNSDTSGRYHSRWLNMIYPRLYLARNLLREDGFISVSIDDNELYNLKIVMDDVFGAEGYVATLVIDRNRKNDAKLFSVGHEYVIVYAKNLALLQERGIILRAPKEGVEEVKAEFDRLRTLHGDDWNMVAAGLRGLYDSYEEDDPRRPLARFTKVDENGPYRTDGDPSWPGGGGPRYDVPHPKTGKPCKVPSRGWVWPTYDRMKEEINKGLICFGADETTIPSVRRNLFEKDDQVMRSVIFSYAQKSAQDFSKIFDGKKIFDNPKSYLDMERLVTYFTGKDDLVMDFFAGSGSLAHGVLEANKKDGGKRRYVLVQLPEPTPEHSQARELGLETIAQICIDRLKRIGNSYRDLHSDVGFRVFTLDRSNFRVWTGELQDDAEVERQLEMHVEHLSSASSADDVLYELLLKAGFSLSTKVQSLTLAGKQVFSIEDRALLICLEKEIIPELIDALAEANPLQVICLDEGFKGIDQLKANAVQTFRARAEAEEAEIVFKTV